MFNFQRRTKMKKTTILFSSLALALVSSFATADEDNRPNREPVFLQENVAVKDSDVDIYKPSEAYTTDDKRPNREPVFLHDDVKVKHGL